MLEKDSFLYFAFFLRADLFFFGFFGYLPGIVHENESWKIAKKSPQGYPLESKVSSFRCLRGRIAFGCLRLLESAPRLGALFSNFEISKLKRSARACALVLTAFCSPNFRDCRVSAAAQAQPQTPPAGLEPAIFGLEVRRLVH